MRRLLIFCLLIQSFFIFSQTTEDFDDGDFGDGSPLSWTASQTSGGNDFIITSGELQSNGPSATGSLFISTNLGIDFNSNDVTWTFKTRYDGGAPSSSNFVEIYLMSDVADISTSPQGYYIRLGESGSTDGIDLFSTNSGTAIISDAGDQVATGIDVHIRVTRTGAGDWTLEADATGGDTFSTIGTATNTDFTSGDFFGFFVRHSSTRNQDFFFDDLVITSTPIPDTTPPSIQSVTAVSQTKVDVLFSESVDQITSETIANYGIDGSVTVSAASRDGSNSSLVHLTTSDMTNGETYSITINNVEDENSNAITANSQALFEYLIIEVAEAGDVVVNEFYAAPSADSAIPDKEFIELLNVSDKFIQLENWTYSDASGTSSAFASFRLDPNEYVILTNTGNGASFNTYGDVLEVANFRALNNGGDDITITNADDLDVFSITYTESISGATTELINPNGPDYSLNNYGQSTDPDGGTPGAVNSIFDDTPDTTPPTIESISVVSSTALDVTFSETLQESSANTSTNYSIDGGISVSSAERDIDNNALVHLIVSELVSGDIRTLTINNVLDLSGNVIEPNSTVEFEYILTEAAIEGDLVINEFYAAPSSDSSIPNVEYVELFNRSEKFIDLAGWTLLDQSGPSSPIGSFIIRPDSFVILTETDNGSLFDSFGDWVEVGNFPTLNNGGDSIIISNGSSLIIHEIKYSESTSGVSMELINPNGPDYSFRNYGESTNSQGGTPGSINSIFDDTQDTIAPVLDSISVISRTQLEVFFDEPLDEPSAETVGNYSIDGGINVSNVVFDALEPSKIVLNVSDLISGDIRTLTVNGVADLSGNTISGATIDFRYIEIEEADAGDVVINEFHASPNSESDIPNREFIELFNRSDKFIDVAGWTFSDLSDISSPFSSFILEPDSFLILTTNNGVSSFEVYGNAIGVSNFQSLNSEDSIIIKNLAGTVIHDIKYTTSISGVSTELINPNGPDYSIRNYGESTNPAGGTPGSINSIFDDTPDTTAPVLDSVSVISRTQLEVFFDEPLDEPSAETVGNYSIDGGINVSNVVFDALEPSKIVLNVSDLISGDIGTLTVNGVADLSGNTISGAIIDFRYIEIEEADAGDVVINEFNASPNADSGIPNREFIELFNRSDKYIDVANWRYSDASDTSSAFPSFVIEPDSFLILTTSSGVSLFEEYGNVIGIGSFSPLRSEEDSIIIMNADSVVIHEIEYFTSTSGISTELINPNGPDYSFRNYGESTNLAGGTPGSINSIFNDTPDTTSPVLDSISVISQTQLEIFFDEPLEESTAENVSNYSIDGSISVTSVIRSENDYSKVILTVSGLVSGDVRTLTASGVSDLSGNATSNATINFRYINIEEAEAGDVLINEFNASPNADSGIPNREFIELFNRSDKYIDVANWRYSDASDTSSAFPSFVIEPDSFLILTTGSGVSFFEEYGNVIGIGNFSSLRSSEDSIIIMNADSVVIHEIEYFTSTSGVSTELINPNGPDYSFRNYGESTNPTGGTPGSINSIFDDTPDTSAAVLDSISVISQTQLEIFFDEPLEESSAENLANYSIDGSISVTGSMRSKTDYSKVILSVSDLVSGEVRTLTVNGVADLSGNVVSGETIDFRYIEIEEAVAGDVVINEFHASPNAESGIPNREFIELFNRSNKFIDVVNWTYSDLLDVSSAFTSFILEPDSFLILTTSSGVPSFETFGDVIGVTNFQSLNSEDSIIIKNSNGVIIHEIEYFTSASGVSAELINPNGPDYSFRNYGLSSDSAGGTPGSINSIFDDTPDATAPILDSISVISQTQLEVFFDEPLEESSAENISNYSIDGSISVTSSMRSEMDYSKVILTVSDLVSGDVRTLTVNEVADLSGNVVLGETIDFRYIEIEEAVAGDVVINEFHANPNAESGIPNREFIELFNRSDKYIDVANWRYSDASDTSSAFPSFVLEPDSFLILTTGSGVALFEEYGNVIGIGNFSSLRSSEDSIIIMNADSVAIHEIEYFTSTSGISTELINTNGPDYSFRNYGESTNSAGGTPGFINSIFDDTPDTTAPVVESIIVASSTELNITFNEPLKKVIAEDVNNYAIADITVSSAQLYDTANYVVQLIISELPSAIVKALTINNVEDLSGNAIADNSTVDFEYLATEEAVFGDILINEFLADSEGNSDDFIELWNVSDKFIELNNWRIRDNAATSTGFSSFVIRPNDFVIIYDKDATIDYSVFGDAITIPSLTLNNTNDQIELLTVDTTTIAFISYSDQPDEGVSSELINPNDPCITELSYAASVDASGITPGRQNSIFDDAPDASPPMITSYNFENELTIRFSESMDLESLQNGAYEIEGLTINEINTREDDLLTVEISFNESLSQGTLYELTVSNVADCWGNVLSPTLLQFGIGRTPEFNEILITEIMADPDPAIVLPDREYIEVYNSTNDIISLNGVIFSDESSFAELPPITINPGSYLVFTTSTGAAEFLEGAVGVSGFPSLSNSGEQLVLSLDESLLFSVRYDKSWHSSLENEVGGVSLEMIDITNPCAEDNNWTSSTDRRGGTPGEQNTVIGNVPDNFPPELISVAAVNEDSIRIDFNEKIDPTLIDLVMLAIEPDISVERLKTNYLYPKSLFLLLQDALEESVLYKLTLSNISDCNGNASGDQRFDFALPLAPTENQILLSEILFNPYTNGVDFVELYNNSDSYLDLRHWQLANLLDEEVANQKVIANQQFVFEPRQFLALTVDPDVLHTNYPKGNRDQFYKMESLPTYANSEGTVVLLNQDSVEMERFTYSSDFHYGLLNSVDGVSLERISYAAFNNANNWRSASSTVGFATPGYQNSQSFEASVPKGTIEIEPKVFLPGNAGSGRDFTLISYQVETAGQFANIQIYDQTGRLVKTLAEGILLSNAGFVRWDGTTNNGSLARLGYHVVLFEIYDSNGNSQTLKETVVVGRDF